MKVESRSVSEKPATTATRTHAGKPLKYDNGSNHTGHESTVLPLDQLVGKEGSNLDI